MASDPERPRSTGRHAAPRLTVRGRMQLPVGRALALTAVPTALLMGSIAPRLAFAADAKAVPVSSTTHEAQTAGGADCGKPTAAPTSKAPTSKASKAAPQTTASTAPTSNPSTAPQRAKGGQAPVTSATPVPGATSTPSPTASPTHKSRPDPIGTLLGTLGGILNPKAETQPPTTTAPKADTATVPGPTATPSATEAPTQAPTKAPTQAPSSTATPTPTATGTPSAPSTPKATDPTLSAKAQANRMCDTSKLAAPLDATVTPGEMPADPWTLKTTKLALGNTQFWGVKTVKTTAGDVRVLKFTAQTVGIGDLDMSVKQQTGEELHVQGGPGTTSTMTGGTVTMYVTSLSGTLAKAEGIPLAELGIKLTLTPDTLPEWLYDLVGSVPVPLNLELDDATAIQAGQFGGNLTIPGMHLFYTPLS